MIRLENLSWYPGGVEVTLDTDRGNTARILYLENDPSAVMETEFMGETFYLVKGKLWKDSEKYRKKVTSAYPEIGIEPHMNEFFIAMTDAEFHKHVRRLYREGAKLCNYKENK